MGVKVGSGGLGGFRYFWDTHLPSVAHMRTHELRKRHEAYTNYEIYSMTLKKATDI